MEFICSGNPATRDRCPGQSSRFESIREGQTTQEVSRVRNNVSATNETNWTPVTSRTAGGRGRVVGSIKENNGPFEFEVCGRTTRMISVNF